MTEPLGERLRDAIDDAPFAAADDRFALNYYRPLAGGRLLWGGMYTLTQTYSCTHKQIFINNFATESVTV